MHGVHLTDDGDWRGSQVVIYTAITGGYDIIRESVKSDCRMMCFTDQSIEKDSCWQFVDVPPEVNRIRQARRLKIRPHFLFDDVTVWIDGAIRLEKVLTEAQVDELLGDADLAIFRHNKRKCIYQEAQACIEFDKDDPYLITEQMARYRKDEFPREFGLAATGVLIRRNTQAMRDFSEMWWSEVDKGSHRDQLSFDYCRWKTGLTVSYLPGHIFSNQLVTCFYHDGRGKIQ